MTTQTVQTEDNTTEVAVEANPRRIEGSAIVFDEQTDGEALLNSLKEKEDKALQTAARNEFMRRAAAFDIDRVTQDLIREQPFYGWISMQLNKIRSVGIPTAAVSVIEQLFVMWWNPFFMTRIAPDWQRHGAGYLDKVQGVLIHEFLHLVLEHTTHRREGIEHPVMWNWATDLAINCMIPREKLPDGLLLPGEELSIPENAENVYEPKHLEEYKKLSKFVKMLPKNLAAEDYYDRLLTFVKQNMPDAMNDPQWGMPKPAKGKGQPQPGGGNGQNSDGDQDGDGQGKGQTPGQGGDGDQEGEGNGEGEEHTSGYGRLGQFDDHNKWDEISDADREQIKQRVKDILRGAIREVDNQANGWGSVPSKLQAQLRKLVSDQIDWRRLLRQFVGFMNHVSQGSTMKKLNRRYPYIHPGRRRSRGARLRIYIDQSGSVGDDDIALLFGELDSLSKKCDFEVYFFDTEVDTKNVIQWRRGSKHPARRVRCGGTDFNAPTQHANKNPDCDGILILTDGECSKPDSCIVKRAWVITPGCKLLFDTDELVIQMERPQSIAAA
jgi:predicted metal-dependent peptidase